MYVSWRVGVGGECVCVAMYVVQVPATVVSWFLVLIVNDIMQ